MRGRLTIVRPGLPLTAPGRGETVVAFDEFVASLKRGALVARLGRHSEGRLLVHRLETSGRPLPLGLALRALCRGPVYLEDSSGSRRGLTLGQLARWIGAVALEPLRVRALLQKVEAAVAVLERSVEQSRNGSSRMSNLPLDLSRPPLYLRTDLSFGVRAGGSVGHIAGVVNNLESFGASPILLTTDDVPTVKRTIEVHAIEPSAEFWNFKELPMFVLNDACERAADRALKNRGISFVYQRYSTNNYSGISIARRRHVPFVLEYNGSEVWVGRHWGSRLRYEDLAERIERLNVTAADLVVVVSRALADQLAETGVDRTRILTNPNGVDPDRYRPDIDGRGVRVACGWDREVVVGFIGTFGPWHGAEILARAFVALRGADPDLSAPVRLLMIGDGATLPSVRRILDEQGAMGATVFTGLVPQERSPEYLAACDILVAPHVPNQDGTPFFGSPTKLFEYMAMGKGIVASDLDQIGEVIEHGRTGWLIQPGNVEALASGLRTLVADASLRAGLGAAARARVLERHTWRQHTRRTLEKLQQRAG
ncbi:MAG: glycosyltransferase WbuB [Acidobacteria bacterium]|nr:MAG: glycosyltransferase WbuB [Acidobacteriota bacterium]